MKIFKSSAEEKKPAPAPAPAATAQAAAPPAPAGAAPPASTGAPAAAAAAPVPDLTAVIDANVKEMSEKIARLATNIEGEKGERADFESKLEKMEERMRKLSALTEMISAQYNPFVGAAPAEREAAPMPEIGLSMPPQTLPIPPTAAIQAPAPLPMPQQLPPAYAAPQQQQQAAPALFAAPPTAAPAPTAAPPWTEPAPAAANAPLPVVVSLDDPFASVASALSKLPPEAHHEAPPEAPAFDAPRDEEPEFEDTPAQASVRVPVSTPEDGLARLWSVRPGFGSSMLMLSWADSLVKTAPNRDCLAKLLDYYQNIGWIGDPARDQLLAYADGLLQERGEDEAAEWRASVELHERSLLFIEKLRAFGKRGD